ncbi:ClpX C4-type zinc finger protein [Nostoc sp.]
MHKLSQNFAVHFVTKNDEQVNLLITGHHREMSCSICNECVDVCNQIISGEIPRLTQLEFESLMNSDKLSG